MFDLGLALRFGAALGLGLLLGLERERKRDAEMLFGGVRTFALIALLGAIGAFMEHEMDQGWLLVASSVALSALVIVSYATTAVGLLLLTLKDFLHGLARRVELADVDAMLQFAVISVIILPLLPNANFGPPPLDVINPSKIWLMRS